jgi:hypothetical protein
LLAVLRGHLIINFKSYSNFGKLRGLSLKTRLLKMYPGKNSGGSQRTPCCVEGLVKSDYVLDPDTGLLLKRAATVITRTPCCAG